MAADNEQELTGKIKAAFDRQSDIQVDPEEARDIMAKDIAKAFFDSMIGRQVTVEGVTSNGGTFQVTGIITNV